MTDAPPRKIVGTIGLQHLNLPSGVIVIPPYYSAPQPKLMTPTPAEAPPTRRRNTMPMLNAKTIKAVVPLDASEVAVLYVPDKPRHIITVSVAGRTIEADVASKSLRKAQVMIREVGPENVFVMLQGRLGPGDVLQECGLVAQAKTPKEAPIAAAA
jgi:hypothetical protein